MSFRSFFIILSLFALTSCKGFLQNDIDNTSQMPTGNLQAFESALQAGYLELAQGELSEDDFPDANYFLKRSKSLLRGGDISPTNIDERNLTPENRAKAVRNREALVRFLDGGARSNRPDVAARTQVMFDCWIQELEENRQPRDISICEEAFMSAIGALEGIASTESAADQTLIQAQISSSEEGENFNTFFAFDRYNTVSDKGALDSFVQFALNKNPAFILITAHTDSSGSFKYNYQLSKKRGEYVRDLLVAAGIDSGIISIVPLGEKSLPVATGDGVKEPRNRRAVIQLRY